MTDEAPKPKRKRRRWFIAGVLLFVVVTGWYWPRGDARFVGTWAVVEGPLVLHSPRETKIVLTADGRGRIDLEDEGRRSTVHYRWWTEDGKFVRRYSPDWGWGTLGNLVYNAYAIVAGKSNPYRQRIVSAEPDRLRLECPNVIIDDRPDVQTLTRIPE